MKPQAVNTALLSEISPRDGRRIHPSMDQLLNDRGTPGARAQSSVAVLAHPGFGSQFAGGGPAKGFFERRPVSWMGNVRSFHGAGSRHERARLKSRLQTCAPAPCSAHIYVACA